jgi:hypothetical protein
VPYKQKFVTVLEAESPKIRVPACPSSGESTFQAAGCCLLIVSSHGGKESLYKDTNPMHETPLHDLINYLPKAMPPTSMRLVVSTSACEFLGDDSIHCIYQILRNT